MRIKICITLCLLSVLCICSCRREQHVENVMVEEEPYVDPTIPTGAYIPNYMDSTNDYNPSTTVQPTEESD